MYNILLEKVIQFRWLEAPTILSPFLLDELRMIQIVDQDSFWMKIILKSLLASNIVLVRTLLKSFLTNSCQSIRN